MNNLRIAIVDDNKEMVELLSSITDAELDIEVVGKAYNGNDAITMIREKMPEIVLLDLIYIGSVAKLQIGHALVVSAIAAVFLLLGMYMPIVEIWPVRLVFRGGMTAINVLIFINIVVNSVIYVVIAVVLLLAGGYAYTKLHDK